MNQDSSHTGMDGGASFSSVPARYRTVLADPPWDILQTGPRGAHRHYPVMSVERISVLPVRRLVADDAHLWLWVTNASLHAGRSVMDGRAIRPHRGRRRFRGSRSLPHPAGGHRAW